MLCMLMAMVDSPEDKRKVEKLYEMYNSLMYSVAYGILNHVQDAEDAVARSWEKIIGHLEKINKIDCHETRSFIVIVTERAAIDLYRKNKKRVHRYVSLADYESSPFFSTRDKALENVELYETMRNLPKQYSEVLILHYVNGLTGKEIADLLEMKESAVMQRLSRARKKLREEMKFHE